MAAYNREHRSLKDYCIDVDPAEADRVHLQEDYGGAEVGVLEHVASLPAASRDRCHARTC